MLFNSPAPFAPLRSTKGLEEKLAAAEAGRAQLEQQLALAHSQLADTRALMDSTQARGRSCGQAPVGVLAGGGVSHSPARDPPLTSTATRHAPACLQDSVHSQLEQWKSLADDKEARLEAAAAQAVALESELRQAATRAEAAAAEARLQHAAELETLAARLAERERELEAAQERAEAAQRAASEREREETTRASASASQVRWGSL